METTLFLVSLFLISIVLLFKRKSFDHNNKLKLPPSPPKLPIISNLHQLGTPPHQSLRALSNKYGPLMLLHLGHVPTLVVSSADMVRQIIKNHDAVFSSRPKTTASDILSYGSKDVAFSPYGEYWRQVRKICVVQLLSLKRVQQFQFVREEETTLLIERIRKDSGVNTGIPLNLSEVLMGTSNDIICRCVIGQSFHSEESGSRNWYGKLTRRASVQLIAFSFGDLFPWLKWIDYIRGFTMSLKSTSKALETFCDQVLEEHKEIMRFRSSSTHDVKDFVDILLSVQQNLRLDFEFTQDGIKAILQDMLMAGTETTSTTLEWLMAELMRNPRVMKRAQEEVRRIVGNKPKIDSNDINNMAYLKCVIKESMRLHPPAPLLVPRETTEKIELGGCHIPAKTQVFINAWAIQRDPKSWDRSEEFLPERFENSSVDFKGQDSQFIPFGFGRRGCPGLAFGIASIEYVIANLLYWFDWKLPKDGEVLDQDRDSGVDMGECYGLTVSKKVPLRLVPIPYFP